MCSYHVGRSGDPSSTHTCLRQSTDQQSHRVSTLMMIWKFRRKPYEHLVWRGVCVSMLCMHAALPVHIRAMGQLGRGKVKIRLTRCSYAHRGAGQDNLTRAPHLVYWSYYRTTDFRCNRPRRLLPSSSERRNLHPFKERMGDLHPVHAEWDIVRLATIV
jgi:hypothetical protein